MMFPLWVLLLMIATHAGMFLAGVWAMHLARQVSMRPTYKAFEYAKQKSAEGVAELAAQKMQKQAQFSYLDSIRKGLEADEDGILPAVQAAKKNK